jgi:chaperonin GroES
LEYSQRRNGINVKQIRNMKKLEALFDAVIVKPLEAEETQFGSIFIPDAGKDRNEQGTVIAVGPGKQMAGIGFVETQIKVGDIVILPTMGFSRLQFDNEEYYIGNEDQILAKIKQGENE